MAGSDIVNKGDPSFPSEEALYNLSSQQYVLNTALGEIGDGSLARVYLGAIYVLEDPANPDRFCLAAHNYRELLSQLPKYLGFDVTPFLEDADNKIISLADSFTSIQQNSNSLDPEFRGEVDQQLRKFLIKLKDFFDWYKKLHPRRKMVRTQTLRSLDPAPVNLPQHIEEELLGEWQDFYRYFSSLAHHGWIPSSEEFAQKVDNFERFLIVRLRPQPFKDIREIDELIKQAESNDRS